jgi:hypothetical protein
MKTADCYWFKTKIIRDISVQSVHKVLTDAPQIL